MPSSSSSSRPPRPPCADAAQSTATYLPVSDSATTASIALSPHHDDAHRLKALTGGRREQDAKLLPFPQAAVAAARAERRGDRLDLLRRGADDRCRIVATVSPFFTVTMRSFQALPPVICCRSWAAA